MLKLTLRFIAIAVAIGCLVAPGSVSGQGTTAAIRGIVYDQSRAVMPGVTVTATDKQTGQKRVIVTDDQGRYMMAQMKIDDYSVQAELPGFQNATRDITLTLEGDAVVNFTLTVGAASTQVTVSSEAPMVETTSSSVAALVDQRQIRDLPLNGRSFSDLTTLQTGVLLNYEGSKTQIGNEGLKIHVAGTRQQGTLFQLDGTDIRNQKLATPGSLAGVLLGVDTVQEFSIITNVPGAEFGHFVGGVVNAITKSGTNNFHGTVFEFLRNSALDARNFFDRISATPLVRSAPPPFRRNQYGFTAGGPIRKDKVFFFGSYEGLRDRLTTTQTDSVPSLDARSGFIPSTGQRFAISPVTRPMLDAYPLPNSTVRPDGTADYVTGARRVVDESYAVGKIDWQVNEKDTIIGRYTIDDAKRLAPIDMDVVFFDSATRSHFILLDWKRIFSSRLINEAGVSLNRTFAGQNPVDQKPLPDSMRFNPTAFTFSGAPWKGAISIPNVATLGFPSSQAQVNTLNRFQYFDNMTFTTGAHSLKAGFSIQRLQFNSAAATNLNGTYAFFTLFDFLTAATPRSFLGAITPLVNNGMRQNIMGFYAQDDWRMRSNLTLNLGVRYEPISLPVEVKGRLGNFRNPSDRQITVGNPWFTVNPSHWNFGPRVGFAWDPSGNGKTSIRAGYGLFYDLISPLLYGIQTHNNPPVAISVTVNNPAFPNPQAGFPADPSSLTTIAPWGFSDIGIKQAGVHQYQLSIQRQIGSDLMLQVSYVGSHGYNLEHLLDRNTAIPQTDASGVFPFFAAGSPRRNSRWGEMRDYAFDASSYYNAFGLTLKKRFTRGYTMQVAYTYGKSTDNASAAGVGENTGGPSMGLSMFPENINFDHALSGFDIRNRVVINGSWDLPFGRGHRLGGGSNGLVDQIAGGWTVNGILTASDGGHSTVTIPFNFSRSAQTNDIPDRPSLIAGGNNNRILSNGREPARYYDPTQFEVPLARAGYFGTAGRNTIVQPGVLTLDFSVQKNFKFTENKYLQFRGEMFNVANRGNFNGPDLSVISSAPTAAAPGGVRSLTAGRITSTITTSRQVQFALKLYF